MDSKGPWEDEIHPPAPGVYETCAKGEFFQYWRHWDGGTWSCGHWTRAACLLAVYMRDNYGTPHPRETREITKWREAWPQP